MLTWKNVSVWRHHPLYPLVLLWFPWFLWFHFGFGPFFPTDSSPKCRKNLLELNGVSWAKVNRPSAHSWKEAGELASGFQRCLFMATAVSGHEAKGSSATQLSLEPEDSSESHAGRGLLPLWVPAVEKGNEAREESSWPFCHDPSKMLHCRTNEKHHSFILCKNKY